MHCRYTIRQNKKRKNKYSVHYVRCRVVVQKIHGILTSPSYLIFEVIITFLIMTSEI